MNVLKALVSINSMCSLMYPFYWCYTSYITWLAKGIFRPLSVRWASRGPNSMRKVDDLSLIFVDFYVPALKVRLNDTENLLQLLRLLPSLLPVALYRCHEQRGLDKHQVFEAYHLGIYCTMWGGANFLVYTLTQIFHLRPRFCIFSAREKDLISLIRIIENLL
jgi:hypothetical protein